MGAGFVPYALPLLGHLWHKMRLKPDLIAARIQSQHVEKAEKEQLLNKRLPLVNCGSALTSCPSANWHYRLSTLTASGTILTLHPADGETEAQT